MLGNGIKQTTSTAGTGALTLAAVTGFPGFSARFSNGVNGDPFHYALIDSAGVGVEWGIGRLSDATTLVREKILATWNGTTYNDATPTAISLSGTYTVLCADNASARPVAPVATDSSLASPRFIIGAQWAANPGAGVAPGANNMVTLPYRLDMTAIVSGVGVKVTTAGAAGTKLRAALYRMDKNGHPGTVITETASGLAVDTTGNKSLTFPASIRLDAGWYFVALLGNGGAALAGSNAQAGGGQCQMWGTVGGDVTGRYIQVAKSVTYADTGALFPNPLGTTGLTYNVDFATAYVCPTLMVTS